MLGEVVEETVKVSVTQSLVSHGEGVPFQSEQAKKPLEGCPMWTTCVIVTFLAITLKKQRETGKINFNYIQPNISKTFLFQHYYEVGP